MTFMKFFDKILQITKLFWRLLVFQARNTKTIRQAEFLFFFPAYHTGGGEKVHLDIVNVLSRYKNIVIIFTNSSTNDHFLRDFNNISSCIHVHDFLELHLRIRGIFEILLCNVINHSKKLQLVFGANSTFFYDILPNLKKELKKVDLIHAFSYPDYGFESYSLKAVPFLDYRITIADKILRDFNSLYSENGLKDYINRVTRIHNLCEFLPINEIQIENKFKNTEVLNIAWIGRNSMEKRLSLYYDLAKELNIAYTKIKFNVVTDKQDTFPQSSNVLHLDKIEDPNKMKEFLSEQHLLIITSYREGLPLVYMEAISQGVVVISTKVGALPDFINNGVNGFLIDENNLVANLKDKIQQISKNIESLIPLATTSLNLFKKEFSQDQFTKQYIDLFLEK
jgi:glycosyltransferase involved in cell wall biosynthesis